MLQAPVAWWLYRLIVLALHKIIIFANNNRERELCPIVVFGFHSDSPLESLDDVLRDHEPKADSLGVHLPCVLKRSKQLE